MLASDRLGKTTHITTMTLQFQFTVRKCHTEERYARKWLKRTCTKDPETIVDFTLLNEDGTPLFMMRGKAANVLDFLKQTKTKKPTA